MKPIAPVSGLTLPLAAGLASVPLLVDAPLWGVVAALASGAWSYAVRRREVDRRPPLPEIVGEAYAPLDVAIAWRTVAGEFPTARRGWRAILTEGDLWLAPAGVGRDYVRIPRLDIVGCALASETELRVRFLDDESRAQEARLTHVPRAAELGAALGIAEDRGTRIV